MYLLALDTSSSDGGVVLIQNEAIDFLHKSANGPSVRRGGSMARQAQHDPIVGHPEPVEGLDAATAQFGRAEIYEKSLILDSISWQAFSNHSAALPFNTYQILKKHRLKVNDLSAIAVCNGPGSYTGIRIGLSFVKGLVALNDMPVICISSLDLLAHQNNTVERLAVCLDARNSDVYAKFYKKKFECSFQIQEEKHVSFKSFFNEIVLKNPINEISFVGSGAIANADFLKTQGVEEFQILSGAKSIQNIDSLAKLASEAYFKNIFFCRAEDLEGNYLREFGRSV